MPLPARPPRKAAAESDRMKSEARESGPLDSTSEELGIAKFPSPRQDRHIPPASGGRSVLTANPSDLLQGLHDGAFKILRQPKPDQVVVDFGRPIGEYSRRGVRRGETQFGSVLFGKKGAHIAPT